ncbi:MAG: hypothetical protein L6R40_005672 [Gallowayella cf. fulva]|nr:MAG: hypothetical protein L6R40_005672 [Xanthomendoza cf. fulva]
MESKEIKGERLLRIRNPWGDTEWQGPWSDGSEQWTPEWMELLNHRFGDDGMFWISYKDFLRKYQSLDRTRLFGPEWRICQQWTTVNVPWSADYNDTKFIVTVTEPGSVVIVLSQLDSRYFRGLEGEYTFEMNFRLEKEGEESFMVRSHGIYSMTRSVSTDVKLEPGTYSVLMKITAKRWVGDSTPDEVVRDSCMNRPEKLIQVGLSYDLAHAKGEIKETEKEKAVREARELKKKAADHQKRRAELRAEMFTEWETAKKRLARRKRQAKRKEDYFKKKAEAAKAAKAAQKAKDIEAPAMEGQPTQGRNSEAPASEDAQVPDETVESKEAEGQAAQAGDEAETEPTGPTASAPLSPPPEAMPINGEDEAGWINKEDAEDEAGKNEAVEPGPADTAEEEAEVAPDEPSEETAPTVEEKEAKVDEDDEDWEIASDASFQSSIVTELDLRSLLDVSADVVPAEDNEADAANVEFEDDPWNAVCVVGLKVYSKDKGLCIETIRPKHELEEADTPLDVDDASKGQSVEKIEETKEKGST